jgi:octaprenyl-diphosphate synthase
MRKPLTDWRNRILLGRARHYGAMARDALAIFPESAPKHALLDVVEFCVSRGH